MEIQNEIDSLLQRCIACGKCSRICPSMEHDGCDPMEAMTGGDTEILECISCGLCAEKCPVGAIPMENPNETLNDICINCMRCVQVCPVRSRALPAPFVAGATQMLSEKAAGYKKPVVFL